MIVRACCYYYYNAVDSLLDPDYLMRVCPHTRAQCAKEFAYIEGLIGERPTMCVNMGEFYISTLRVIQIERNASLNHRRWRVHRVACRRWNAPGRARGESFGFVWIWTRNEPLLYRLSWSTIAQTWRRPRPASSTRPRWSAWPRLLATSARSSWGEAIT